MTAIENKCLSHELGMNCMIGITVKNVIESAFFQNKSLGKG